MTDDGYVFGPNGVVTAPDGRTASQGFHILMDTPCGGISTNGSVPPVCEIHMLPWGHNRAKVTS